MRLVEEMSTCLTPGISGERQDNKHERNPVARVRCMPLLGAALIITIRFILRDFPNCWETFVHDVHDPVTIY